MLIMCIARTFFITCVPLFLMLTGYLMNKKEWSAVQDIIRVYKKHTAFTL